MKFDLTRLRAERIAKGLTQEKMAEKLDLSRNGYWKKENGQRDFSMKEFTKILDILGYSKKQLPIFLLEALTIKNERNQNKWKTN